MRSRSGLLAAAAVTLVAGGCGGGEGGGESGALRVSPPSQPAPSACATRALATGRSPDRHLAPAPGVYRYRAKGERAAAGGSDAQPLGSTIAMTATKATRVGRLLCFRVQHRYATALAQTATFVVRGPWLYLTELEVQAGAQRSLVRPDPPVLALAPSEVEWNGSFSGPTRGSYSARIVGRRRFKLGRATVRAVGVELDLQARGRVSGSERSVRWFAVDRSIAVAEEVGQDRRMGLERSRLDYTAELVSATPEPAP